VKTRAIRIIAIAGLVLSDCSFLQAQIPDWYSTHKSFKFPAEMYILGVGAGSGSSATENAKKAAQMDVVSQIRVQIQAEIKNVSESFQFNKDEQLFSDYRSKVRTAASEEITGMEVVETVTDKSTGTSYALVVLDRDKFCETMRGEMETGWKQADELRLAALDYAKRGKLSDAIQNLMDARKAVTPLLTKQTLYNVVAHSPYKPAVSFGPATLSSDIRKLLSQVKLAKLGGDKQKGKVGESFAEPFLVQVTLAQEGKSVPVVGSTLVFESSDKTKVGEATTDEGGTGSLSTTIRAMTGNGIRARLMFDNLGRDYDQSLLSSSVNFTWKAEASNVSFALKITAKSAKSSNSLKNAFSSAITQIGYKVVSSSNFVLEITVEAGQSGKVEGLAGTMYSVSADVVATLTDKESGNTLGTTRFTGKGLARSEAEATDRAVANVKIGQKELGELLETAVKK
jgi:hypothetical protein